MMTSKCLTLEQTHNLIDAGALFDTVVFLDGSGAEITTRLSERYFSKHGGEMPRLERVDGFDDVVETIRQIHNTLDTPGPNRFFDIDNG